MVLLFGYGRTWAYLLEEWWTHPRIDELSVGLVAIAVAAIVLWSERNRLSVFLPRPSWVGAVAVLMLSLLWAASVIVDVRALETTSAIFLVASMSCALLGWRVTIFSWFSVIYLALAAPIWEPLVPVLQNFTALSASWVLQQSAIPVYLEGYNLVIPAGTFQVAAECSGLRYLLTGIVIACLNARINHLSTWSGLGFVALAIAMALLANVTRIVLVIVIGHYTEMQHPWVDDHLYLGWCVFGLLLIPLLLIAAWLPGDGDSKIAPKEPVRIRGLPVLMLGVTGLSFVALTSGPTLVSLAGRSVGDVEVISIEAPQALGSWNGPLRADGSWQPEFRGADGAIQVLYTDRIGRSVQLYFAHYLSQSNGKEIVNVHNQLFSDKHWRMAQSKSQAGFVQLDSWPLQVGEIRLESFGGQSRMLWYWYEVAGRYTRRPWIAKMYQLRGWIDGDAGASVYALVMDYESSSEVAREALADFLAVHGLELRKLRSASQISRYFQAIAD